MSCMPLEIRPFRKQPISAEAAMGGESDTSSTKPRGKKFWLKLTAACTTAVSALVGGAFYFNITDEILKDLRPYDT